MVSACAYSGAYPTGYGKYDDEHRGRSAPTLRRAPGVGIHALPAVRDRRDPQVLQLLPGHADGRVRSTRSTPSGPSRTRVAEPGYYAAIAVVGHPQRADRRSEVGGPPLHVPRPRRRPDRRRLLARRPRHRPRPHGPDPGAAVRPWRPASPRARSSSRACPLAVHIECDASRWRQMLWYDRRLMAGGSRLEFDSIRLTTLRPFGLMFVGPTESGEQVELRMGFSLRGVDQAEANLHSDCGTEPGAFDRRRAETHHAWRGPLRPTSRSKGRRASSGRSSALRSTTR